MTLFDLHNPEPAPPRSLPYHGRTMASRATSQAAARSAAPRQNLARELVFQALSRASWGLTDEEIVEATGLSPNTARPRRVELVAAGRVRASGVTRHTSSTGSPAVVWEAVR